MRICLTLLALLAAGWPAPAQVSAPGSATRSVFLDVEGVIRWQDSREEVALFGANYTLPSASDYRAAGYLGADRRRMIDEDMAQFARMGWDALRLSFWGDWENSDQAGNLLENDHLDLQDYLIARARARGIYILFSPITTYNAGWPDALGDANPGFSRYYDRGKLGTDSAAWVAQANYIRQLLEHVNPYTGVALKDEPAILFIEPINEPWHRPEDRERAVRYINMLVEAVRSTGCKKLVFHNVSQDFAITDAILESRMQGITFGWYPTGLNSGRELKGNYLRTVDHFNPMLDPRLAHLPRIVYEFDSPDLRTGYMYPAMVRTFRAAGAQFAAMFSYDMLRTSSRNLGWQTHYLNLVYTPRKAVSSIIAAEAMRRLPRMRAYGAYPANTRFGDFRVSYEDNSSELLAADAFIHAGPTRNPPPRPARLERVVGYGSSPLVSYEGKGIYFLDRLRPGLWRLEVYPDAVPVRDPFEMPNAEKIVTRAIYRSWPMAIALPDLGGTFSIHRIDGAHAGRIGRAQDGRFNVVPGVYVLSASGDVDPGRIPAFAGRVGMAEIHLPAADTLPVAVAVDAAPEYVAGQPVDVGVRVASDVAPDSVTLFIRPLGRAWFSRYSMESTGGYDYRVRIAADSLKEGPHQYVISVAHGPSSTTFPEGIRRRPWDWDFSARTFWQTTVVRPETPLHLFRPATDVTNMSFTRIGDAGRQGIFSVVPSIVTGEAAFHLELPVVGEYAPPDYTASLVIKDRIAARGAAIASAKTLKIRLRGIASQQVLHVTLVEKDGTSWSAPVTVGPEWIEPTIALTDLKIARSVKLPQGFPGQWSYWLGPAQGRGGSGDGVRIAEVERLQMSLRNPGGVEVEAITVVF